jgi:hypothetical protein
MKISFVCHLLATLILVTFGVIYIFRSEFMPYHSDAVGMPWGEVSLSFQILILAFMRVIGCSFLAFGLLETILLLVPFRQGIGWVLWAIPISGLVICAGTLYATLYVGLNTPASPPLMAPVAVSVFLLTGLFLSMRQREDMEA